MMEDDNNGTVAAAASRENAVRRKLFATPTGAENASRDDDVNQNPPADPSAIAPDHEGNDDAIPSPGTGSLIEMLFSDDKGGHHFLEDYVNRPGGEADLCLSDFLDLDNPIGGVGAPSPTAATAPSPNESSCATNTLSYSLSHKEYFDGLEAQQQQPQTPDFGEATNNNNLMGPPSRAADSPQGAPQKMVFKESFFPVPASYHRSQSFSVRTPATMDPCFDQDIFQSSGSPPRPSRSLSCPESQMSGQDSILVYEEALAYPPHPVGYQSAGAPEGGAPGRDSRVLRDHCANATMMHHHQHHHQQYAYPPHPSQYQREAHPKIYNSASFGAGGVPIHKGTVISSPAAHGAGPSAPKTPSPAKRSSKKASGSSSAASGDKSKSSEKKSATKTPRTSRSSRFRGVTKHRRSGRWEAHIWVRETGKQVYLGGYELEEHAAEAYDVAALKCKGKKVKTNFDISKYAELVQYMDTISLDELVMAVRRESQGFARGSSKYRGVTRHPNGRWEARIGMPGKTSDESKQTHRRQRTRTDNLVSFTFSFAILYGAQDRGTFTLGSSTTRARPPRLTTGPW